VKTSEQLYDLVLKYEKKYPSLKTDDAKVLVLQMTAMKSLRALGWRVEKLLGSYIGDGRIDSTNTSINILITGLRSVHAFNNLFNSFANRDFYKAGFDFLTVPNKLTFVTDRTAAKGSKACRNYTNWGRQLVKEDDFRDYLACEVYPHLELAEKRLDAILDDKNFKKDDILVWDNRIFMGPDSFKDKTGNDADRFRKVTKSDLQVLAANLQFAKHNAAATIAYRLEGAKTIFNNMGKEMTDAGKTIFSNILNDGGISNLDGLTPYERRRRIVKFGNFLKGIEGKFRGKDRKGWMFGQAYPALQKWFDYADKARVAIKDNRAEATANDQQFLFNPLTAQPVNNITEQTFQNLKDLIKGGTVTFHSLTDNGNYQKVNLKAFYQTPPEDLKAFIPPKSSFNRKKMKESREITIKLPRGKQVKALVRNYDYEVPNFDNPKQWKPDELRNFIQLYSKYFPEIDSGSDKEKLENLKRATRVISQAWGGLVITAPLTLTLM
jgi:hypothetical protein